MSQPDLHDRSLKVKQLAAETGFDLCGISMAGYMSEEASLLDKWLRQNRQGQMTWLANHFEKRTDPQNLVEEARTVISLTYNYFPENDIFPPGGYKIARYAYGQDYHRVIKKKLTGLLEKMRLEFGEIQGRVFVDSAPVLERQWAARSGLGWIGKNTLLINRDKGSYFFLAEIISDLELEPDQRIKDYCGSCTKCLDACPTQALTPYEIDARKCISYLTIELKNEIPAEFKGKYEDWIFGCDICQEVCPWNRFSKPHHEPAFTPGSFLENLKKKDWEDMTEEDFHSKFEKSALMRTKFSGMKRNISFLKSSGKNTPPRGGKKIAENE